MAAVAARAVPTVATLVRKEAGQKAAPAVRGLPALHAARVTCSAQEKKSAVLSAAVSALTASVALPSLAVVEKTLGGEGVGLPLGLSDSGLGWILAGGFTTIWALYFVYSSQLPEGDDDSGLGL